MLEVLEGVGRPERLGFQADMAHTLLYTLGYNAEADRLLPANFTWDDQDAWQAALKRMTDALRPWTLDFHVAQNDATVKGTGSHDKTGRHCLPDDPNGKLDPVKDAAPWLRGADGQLTKAFQHICWDGCMFSNDVMLLPQTLGRHPWRDDEGSRRAWLAAIAAGRQRHGKAEAQCWFGRLRLHGPHTFQRLPPGRQLLRPAATSRC